MTSKDSYLKTAEREHATTLRVLRAFPPAKSELRPHPKCKTARELAWVFVLECGLGAMVLNKRFPQDAGGKMPDPPADWNALIGALEKAHADRIALVGAFSDAEMAEKVSFLTGPKTVGEVSRMEFCWFLLHDEIHHRGQLSVYLRLADGTVPSIYGPSADEPWM